MDLLSDNLNRQLGICAPYLLFLYHEGGSVLLNACQQDKLSLQIRTISGNLPIIGNHQDAGTICR